MLSSSIIYLCFCLSHAQEWIHGKGNKCIVTFTGPQNHSIMRYVTLCDPFILNSMSFAYGRRSYKFSKKVLKQAHVHIIELHN